MDEAPPSHDHLRLIRKLESVAALSAEDRQGVAELPLTIKQMPADTDLVREGDRPKDCCVLIDGFACRYKILEEGQRQILSFHIPGDIPDAQSLHLKVMDHSLATLTPCRVAFVPHVAMFALIGRQPNVGAALWRDTLIDAAILREWLAGVGRRDARTRVAHLLCEMFAKMHAVGLSDDMKGFELPVTQAELGDSLGLSTVHINRVLQDLRRDGLIGPAGKYWKIGDWPGLKAAAGFNGDYLHLRQRAP